MNKYFVVTLYTVMILTSFFQSDTTESQHAQSLETNKYVMSMMVDPGGG